MRQWDQCSLQTGPAPPEGYQCLRLPQGSFDTQSILPTGPVVTALSRSPVKKVKYRDITHVCLVANWIVERSAVNNQFGIGESKPTRPRVLGPECRNGLSVSVWFGVARKYGH